MLPYSVLYTTVYQRHFHFLQTNAYFMYTSRKKKKKPSKTPPYYCCYILWCIKSTFICFFNKLLVQGLFLVHIYKFNYYQHPYYSAVSFVSDGIMADTDTNIEILAILWHFKLGLSGVETAHRIQEVERKGTISVCTAARSWFKGSKLSLEIMP